MHYSATDIVLIITAIGGLIGSTIAALKVYKVETQVKNVIQGQSDSSDKLDSIKDKVNGNLSASKNETEYYAQLVEELRGLVSKTTFDIAKSNVDKKLAEVGNRRADDVLEKKTG